MEVKIGACVGGIPKWVRAGTLFAEQWNTMNNRYYLLKSGEPSGFIRNFQDVKHGMQAECEITDLDDYTLEELTWLQVIVKIIRYGTENSLQQ